MTDYIVPLNDGELDIILGALEIYHIEHSRLLVPWDASTSISKLRKTYLEEIGRLQEKIIYDILDTDYDKT